MIGAVQALWRSLRHFNHRGYIYVWANLLCVVCSLPIVTFPAAWAGLVKMSYTAYTGPTADINDFWEGFKENLGRGVILSVLNLVIVGINVTNLLVYGGGVEPTTALLRVVWVSALVLWIGVQLYLFPIFYHMETPTLRGAMRNALVMMYLNPLYTLVVLAVVAVIVVVSIYVAALWFLLTLSLIAALVTGAVLDRLGVQIYTPITEQE